MIQTYASRRACGIENLVVADDGIPIATQERFNDAESLIRLFFSLGINPCRNELHPAGSRQCPILVVRNAYVSVAKQSSIDSCCTHLHHLQAHFFGPLPSQCVRNALTSPILPWFRRHRAILAGRPYCVSRSTLPVEPPASTCAPFWLPPMAT